MTGADLHRADGAQREPPALRDIPLERIVELAERLDVRGPRYTTVPVWRTDAAQAAEAWREGLAALGPKARPIAVYLHLPFCRSRCLYCGCNSFITRQESRIRRYVDAIEREIDRSAELLGPQVVHGHLHLGGGTPTYMPAAMLGELLDRLIERIPGAATAERSIEVDPRVTTGEHLRVLGARGFRRISIGLQDLDPTVQQAVRREYSFEELRAFVASARSAGFTGVNLDLIYGLPRQTRSTWLATLQAILELSPDRLACFGYAHLPARMAHQRAIDERELPTPAARLELLLEANRFFDDHGYEAIGMDHFARPEDELALARRRGRLWRNFMGYTTTRGLELLGLGCSGISELSDAFVQNEVAPERYAERLDADESPLVRVHRLDADDRYRKELINHLMCNMELDLSDPPEWAPPGLGQELREAARALAPLEAEGLVVPSERGFQVTPLGQLFVRNLAMPFDRYLPKQGATTFSRTV
jgi:oxygen-independent coproporphyrinogen-3 oxidase